MLLLRLLREEAIIFSESAHKIKIFSIYNLWDINSRKRTNINARISAMRKMRSTHTVSNISLIIDDMTNTVKIMVVSIMRAIFIAVLYSLFICFTKF